MGNKLFAVYLGGRAPKCNTELHDVVFAVGESIEATYPRLMDKWFGDPRRVHLDSNTDNLFDVDDCLEISEVDGWHIHLEPTTETQPFEPGNGFHVIPKPVVAAYVEKRGLR